MSAQRIGKYQIIAKLGQGGMARVHLALSAGPAGFSKLMVIKELKEELVGDPEFRSMFLDEARLAARLNHANVVHTYEVGQDGDRYFIAMDYLEGQPLNALLHRVKRRKMPLDVHLRILADVLKGLHYAHTLKDYNGSALGVVHRDVTPHNVFITYEGQSKLLDFGIAKAANSSTHTKQGVIKGKIAYMAPEQALGMEIDSRSDLFAVGVMLWEALAERVLTRGQPDLLILEQRVSGKEPKLADVQPDAPPALVRMCERAMSLKPDNRYESAEQFQEEIEDYLSNSAGRVSAKDVSALISEAFQEERSKVSKLIENHMAALHSGDTKRSELLELPLPSSGSGGSPGSGSTPLGSTTDAQPSDDTDPTLLNPSPDGAKRRPALWAAGALAVGAVVLVMVLSAGEEPVTAPSAPVPETKTPEANEEKPAAEAAVEVKVTFTPKNARVTLDGAAMRGNPAVHKAPKDDNTHRLSVTADGYKTHEEWVSLSSDVALTIELEPKASAKEEPPKPTAVRRPSGPRSPPPPPPPPPPTKKPGGARTIDTDNPY